MLNGKHISFWIDSVESADFPPLKDKTTVDVAIIGGGIVGLTTGLMLKEQGLKIAIVESKRIGCDVSGSTTAKITISSNLIYDHIVSNFDLETASKFRDANMLAFNKIAEIIEEHSIDCDYKKVPLYIYSTDKKNFKDIEKEYETLKKLDIDAILTDKLPIPFNKDLNNNNNNNNSKDNNNKDNNEENDNDTNENDNNKDHDKVINKALKYPNQGEFHPKKYNNALVKLITGDGSYMFENTKVTNIEEGDTKKISTENGDIFANSVVVATNSPIYDPNSTLSYMYQVKSYMLGAYVKEKLPSGMFVNIEPFHTFRTTPTKKGDLLIIGGEHHFTGQIEDTDNCFKKLVKFAKEKFNVESIEYFWSNQDAKPDDRLPIIGETSQKGIYVATGFESWGIVKGTLAGIILTDLILNKENSYAEIFSPKRLKNQNSIKKRCASNFNTKDLNEEEAKILNDSILKLEQEEGKIVKLPNRAIAIYKDLDSNVFAFHGNCSHYGCELKWNSAEKSWDCPQHGSRFDYKGNSIHGPAIANLKPI
ncbi:gamma-glutamylputrescine oxidoreductase [Methanobrevibacter cuticularis]|uniref:Gamma-glutamylputrescine oxidoreductase n=1 Tax=Methanobrevibacter cuticularis TaxID=47311 RepID=A0A166ER64_9EURY|nr:FAD-dependent oxidoreductase [Methanobrevibacter cuticularis]KZX16922.1 gamma-glutamylputrescine oxidoreductase [Methanobrevibacter cuticularis]